MPSGHRPPTAVLVGFETDVCVFQSAVGLLDEGRRVLVVEDAMFSPGEMQPRGLARLRDAGARPHPRKALAYEWVRTVERTTALLSSGVLGPAPFRLRANAGRGTTEQVALAGADGPARRRAGLAHERELRVGLDALGDHGRVRARGVGDHGLQHAERGRVVLGVGDRRSGRS